MRCTKLAAIALILTAELVVAGCGGGGGSHTEFPPNPPDPARTEVAGLNGPEGLTFDSAGNLYAGSQNGRIVRVTPGGAVSTFAETEKQLAGLATGPQDEIFAASFGTGEVIAVSQGGTIRTATRGLDSPNGIVFDPNQRALVSAFGIGGAPQIARIEPDGTFRTLTEKVRSPNGLAFGPDGLLYVADSFMNRVVRMTIDAAGELGEPEVYAGGLPFADGIALDDQGNLYVAASGKIMVVLANGDRTLRDFVTAGDVDGPASLAFGAGRDRDRGRLYFTNFGFPGLGTGTSIASVLVGIPGQRLFAP